MSSRHKWNEEPEIPACRRDIYRACQLTQDQIATVEQLIHTAGTRKVGVAALNNVRTTFWSQKNAEQRVFESHTCEQVFAYELELDPHVIAYYSQINCDGIERTLSNGRRHISSACLDFLVLRKDRIEIVECKQKSWLVEEVAKGRTDWAENDSGWTHPPYASWAESKDLPFLAWIGPEHPAVYLKNLEFLYAQYGLELSAQAEIVARRISQKIAAKPQNLRDLALNVPGVDLKTVCALLNTGNAFGPVKSTALQDALEFFLFSDPDQAKLYETSKLKSLSRRLAQPDVTSQTLSASRADLDCAKARIQRLHEASLAPASATRVTRALKKRVDDAESRGISPLEACIPRYRNCGNRIPRISNKHKEIIDSIVQTFWVTGRIIRAKDLDCAYQEACESHGVPILGISTLHRVRRQNDGSRRALALGGLRAYQAQRKRTDPRVSTEPPLAFGQVAHIDSSDVDLRFRAMSFNDGAETEDVGKIKFYIAIDGATGYPLACAFILGSARTTGLAKLFREIVRRHSFLPRMIHVDRGSENLSAWTHEFCFGRISIRHSPTAASAWNGIAESAIQCVNREISHKLFGSTKPDALGRKVDGRFKSRRTACLDAAEALNLVRDFIYAQLPHIAGTDHRSPEERRRELELEGLNVGIPTSFSDSFYVETSVPIRTRRIDRRGAIRLTEGVYTSHELQDLSKTSQIEEVRLDPDDQSYVFVRMSRVWVKAYKRGVQSATEDLHLALTYQAATSAAAPRAKRTKNTLEQELNSKLAAANSNSAREISTNVSGQPPEKRLPEPSWERHTGNLEPYPEAIQ